MKFKTQQEEFWAGQFGREYIARNKSTDLLNSNINLFNKILNSIAPLNSIVELGCNVGMNLKALHSINPKINLSGYEINDEAAKEASELNIAKIIQGTIIEPLETENLFDLSFTKGVLIHIQPEELNKVYLNLFSLSRKYILICEYYNPTPVKVEYHGVPDRLFKRDFAGEMIGKFNLKLIDYGFVYHLDKSAPQDDLTWFLMEK
jgi:pseudaminic acid biosynthesis-associated methylase